MSGLVISLCDRTGNMVRPWLEAGYRAVTVDIQDAPEEPGRLHIVRDVRGLHWSGEPPVMVFAFPPCTHLAVSGAKHFQRKGLGKLIEALEIVEACRAVCEYHGAPWMLENPVSTLSTYWRKPDHIFHPWQYTAFELGDHYTKTTCLWTGGGFIMPAPAQASELAAAEPDDRIHKAPPSDERADFRSATPMGFARAVFKANALAQEVRAA